MKKLSSREKKFVIVLLVILLSGLLYIFQENISIRSFGDNKNKRIDEKRSKFMKVLGMTKNDLSVAYQKNSNFCLINEDCASFSYCEPSRQSKNKFFKPEFEDKGSISIDWQTCNNVVSCVSNSCVAVKCHFLLCGIERLFN